MSTATAIPDVGAYVIDTRDGRVGEVMGREGARLRLRPVGGGREWECAPGATRCATAGERLRAETRYANARSRGERA
ncbi:MULTISPECIES: hypothetical protein [Streptomyces]|uniref:Uncharacterized protein n=1 Tax=Streptomyces yunnanensis TaxID=156453 RepID=A0ABY8AM97_9ACTN|nr:MULTISPECIES: hypothetical protein [Streptomyces]AJC58461.1 hypothetical protein GZL_05886 [Streptomyces sp. 769]WEB46132.1 hypothetical protein MOV08_27765 [Streptomyces yunnanensis]